MSLCRNCGNEYELPVFSSGANHYDLVDYFCEECGRYLDTIEVGGNVFQKGFGWTLENERENTYKTTRSF